MIEVEEALCHSIGDPSNSKSISTREFSPIENDQLNISEYTDINQLLRSEESFENDMKEESDETMRQDSEENNIHIHNKGSTFKNGNAEDNRENKSSLVNYLKNDHNQMEVENKDSKPTTSESNAAYAESFSPSKENGNEGTNNDLNSQEDMASSNNKTITCDKPCDRKTFEDLMHLFSDLKSQAQSMSTDNNTTSMIEKRIDESSAKNASGNDSRSCAKALENVLMALYEDVKHIASTNYKTESSTKVVNKKESLKDAFSQTQEKSNQFNNENEKPKELPIMIDKDVNTADDLKLRGNIFKENEELSLFDVVKNTYEIYDSYKQQYPEKFRLNRRDFTLLCSLIATIENSISENKGIEKIDLKQMLDSQFNIKPPGYNDNQASKPHDDSTVEAKNRFGVNDDTTNFDLSVKEPKRFTAHRILRNCDSNDAVPNASFSYYVLIPGDELNVIEQCFQDCEMMQKQHFRLTELLERMNESGDPEIMDQCIGKIGQIKYKINEIKDRRLYEVQQLSNVRITMKESSNRIHESGMVYHKISLSGDSFKDIEKTIERINEKLPSLSPSSLEGKKYYKNSGHHMLKTVLNSFPPNENNVIGKHIPPVSSGLNDNNVLIPTIVGQPSNSRNVQHSLPFEMSSKRILGRDSSALDLLNESVESSMGYMLLDNARIRKYKYSRVLKVILTEKTKNLFRHDRGGRILSKRLIDIENKYKIYFGKVEVLSDDECQSKSMICSKVYYDLEDNAQKVFDLLNIYVIQNS